MTDPELNPCPHCKAKQSERDEEHKSLVYIDITGVNTYILSARVHCRYCEAYGPMAETAKEAANLWNNGVVRKRLSRALLGEFMRKRRHRHKMELLRIHETSLAKAAKIEHNNSMVAPDDAELVHELVSSDEPAMAEGD